MVRASSLLACCLLVALSLVIPAASYPRYQSNYFQDEDQLEPEEIVGMIGRLNNLLQFERKMASDKRALDLGLNRGYTGAIQAKHLMGIAAANYAGGPGRRRRNAQ